MDRDGMGYDGANHDVWSVRRSRPVAG